VDKIETELQQGISRRPVITATLLIFLAGAIFWAGATYNRVDGIDQSMRTMQLTLKEVSEKLSDVQAIRIHSQEQDRRLADLEKQVNDFEYGKAYEKR
jgi:hypothetical protein